MTANDRDPIWDALKAHSKEKFDADRQRFMQDAVASDDERDGCKVWMAV